MKDPNESVLAAVAEAMKSAKRQEYVPGLIAMLDQDLNVTDTTTDKVFIALWNLRTKTGRAELKTQIEKRMLTGDANAWRPPLHVLAQIGSPEDFDFIANLRVKAVQKERDREELSVLIAMAIYAEASGDRRTLPYLKDLLCNEFRGGFFYEEALYAVLALAEMLTEDDSLFLTTLHWQTNPFYKDIIRQIRNNLDLPPEQRKSTAVMREEILEYCNHRIKNSERQVMPMKDQIPEEAK
jgi:hypothetical protein